MKTKLLLTAVFSLLTSPLLTAQVPPVGSAAPDFSLADSNGKTHSLSQYKGKYVVLEWFNPECPFVKKHYGSDNMQKLQDEYTSKGAIDSKASPNPADIPSSTNYVKVALDESLAGKPVTTANTKPYGCSVKYQ